MNNRTMYLSRDMPEVSVGTCKNYRNCKAFATDLANGWCVNCWDRGYSFSPRTTNAIKKREEEKKSKDINRIETRGRHIKNCTCEYHKSKGFI